MLSDPVILIAATSEGYHRVPRWTEQGVLIESEPLGSSLTEAWRSTQESASTLVSAATFVPWEQLCNPLPSPVLTVACGLTYPTHQRETKLSELVCFRKETPPQYQYGEVAWRPYLDYELEVGLVIPPDDVTGRHPRRIGFILANDWTDRKIQVDHHKRGDPTRGFTQAKSFAGALGVGGILCLAPPSFWQQVSAELYVNGELKQSLLTSQCLLDAEKILATPPHDPLLETSGDQWTLVLTGAPGGTLFQAPRRWEIISAMIASGLSIAKAKQRFLDKQAWLRPGDQIYMRSPQLGIIRSRIAEIPSQTVGQT